MRVKLIPSTGGKYRAGEDGHIYPSKIDPTRFKGGRPSLTEKLDGSMKDMVRRGGYLRVKLFVNGRSITKPVHRLVAEAWLDGYSDLYEVHHLNHVPTDNRPCNLVLMTRLEHMREHGLAVTDVEVADERAMIDELAAMERSNPKLKPLTPRDYMVRRDRSTKVYVEQMIRNAEWLEAEFRRRRVSL